MSYLAHFGLAHEPFSNAPHGRFWFAAPQAERAIARVMHAISQAKGLAVVVGEVGRGKTTLARRILDSLPEAEYEAALLVVLHADVTATWLLKRIAVQLGVQAPAAEKPALLGQLYGRLLEIHDAGRKAVVLIDEAQMLQGRELMEELRGLLNLELPERKLLSLVLFGLPELEKGLELDPPLRHRVALKCTLESYDIASTFAYLDHRLELAGAPRPLFTEGARQAIHGSTGGTPRLINTLCDNALLEAFLSGRDVVDEELVGVAAEALGLPRHEVNSTAPPAVQASMEAPIAVPEAPVPVQRPVVLPLRRTTPEPGERDRYLEGTGKL